MDNIGMVVCRQPLAYSNQQLHISMVFFVLPPRSFPHHKCYSHPNIVLWIYLLSHLVCYEGTSPSFHLFNSLVILSILSARSFKTCAGTLYLPCMIFSTSAFSLSNASINLHVYNYVNILMIARAPPVYN